MTDPFPALTSGAGCYAAYLTPQGRMIADVFVYELGDAMLLVVPRRVKDTVLARLDRFVFTEDVTLADATDLFGEIAIVGPAAGEFLSRVLGNVAPAPLMVIVRPACPVAAGGASVFVHAARTRKREMNLRIGFPPN